MYALTPYFCTFLTSLQQETKQGSQHPAQHSRIKDLISRLPFRRQSQQVQPGEERLRHSTNGVTQFLRQHFSFRWSRPWISHKPPTVNVAAGHCTEVMK